MENLVHIACYIDSVGSKAASVASGAPAAVRRGLVVVAPWCVCGARALAWVLSSVVFSTAVAGGQGFEQRHLDVVIASLSQTAALYDKHAAAAFVKESRTLQATQVERVGLFWAFPGGSRLSVELDLEEYKRRLQGAPFHAIESIESVDAFDAFDGVAGLLANRDYAANVYFDKSLQGWQIGTLRRAALWRMPGVSPCNYLYKIYPYGWTLSEMLAMKGVQALSVEPAPGNPDELTIVCQLELKPSESTFGEAVIGEWEGVFSTSKKAFVRQLLRNGEDSDVSLECSFDNGDNGNTLPTAMTKVIRFVADGESHSIKWEHQFFDVSLSPRLTDSACRLEAFGLAGPPPLRSRSVTKVALFLTCSLWIGYFLIKRFGKPREAPAQR